MDLAALLPAPVRAAHGLDDLHALAPHARRDPGPAATLGAAIAEPLQGTAERVGRVTQRLSRSR